MLVGTWLQETSQPKYAGLNLIIEYFSTWIYWYEPDYRILNQDILVGTWLQDSQPGYTGRNLITGNSTRICWLEPDYRKLNQDMLVGTWLQEAQPGYAG